MAVYRRWLDEVESDLKQMEVKGWRVEMRL
jgi:hypothetical protein